MKNSEIPSFAYRLFQWFCKDHLFEELQGDLEEKFLINKEKYGLVKARRMYRKEVLKMIRPSIMKKNTSVLATQMALLASYLTLSLRNIQKHKLFSFINIFSLSVAMSAGLLVLGMINDLLKFDTFHENKDEIYRVISTPHYQNRDYKTVAASPFALGDEIKNQIPGLQVTKLGKDFGGMATINEKKIEIQAILADEHFFDFLSFDLVKGRKQMVLSEPFSIVISQSLADKTFGEENPPIGQSIELEGFGTFTITGIVADPPKFSHLQFEAIGSLSTIDVLVNRNQVPKKELTWAQANRYYTYLLLPEHLKKNAELWLDQSTPSQYNDPEKVSYSFELQALMDIIPGPNIGESIGPKMIHLPVIILSIIAAAILLSAIFNYTNLSMARALKRTREVGIRKLNGAGRSSIFLQFSCEAIILSLLSLGIGIFLFTWLKPEFINIIPRANQVLTLDLTPQLIGWFVAFAIVAGLIAGLAPALYFARLSSLKSLRSSGTLRTLSKINFRKGLIVAQFTLSIMFVLAVAITNRLHGYLLTQDLGFNSENILNITLADSDPELLRTEMLKIPDVKSVSFSSYIPGMSNFHNLRVVDPRNQDSVWVHTINVDHLFLDNLDIELVAGRNFIEGENKNQEQSMIVNERFIEFFDFDSPNEIIGRVFDVEGSQVSIVGVVKDFHYAHLEEQIKVFAIRNSGRVTHANVKIIPSNILESYERIEATWNDINPTEKMNASFFDDQLNDHYSFLVDIMKMFGFVGVLAISISCLGLFGMTIYSTEIRMKEIGIRKTFGATDKALIFLLSKGFLRLILWAIVIGVPICYLVFDKLILAQYYYRMNISFVEIGTAILFLTGLSFLTILTQTWSAARTNPSEVLRNE